MKFRYVVALSLAGALLLGACGGDDDDGGNAGATTGPTQSATQGSDATKASTGGTQAPDPTKAPDSKTPEDARSIFDKLASDSIAKKYQATYSIEITSAGRTQKGTSIIASDPPRLATKISFTEGDLKGGFLIISDGKNEIVCNDFGFGGQCNKSAGTDPSLNPSGIDLAKTVQTARTNSDVKELARRTIAGRSSRCFEATDKGTGTVSNFCLDEKDSVMTYMEIGGITKLTATEISNTVDAKLFDPPYPVK